MSTGKNPNPSKLAVQLGALAQGEVGLLDHLLRNTDVQMAPVIPAADALTFPFSISVVTGGPVVLMGVVNVECSAANIECTIQLKKGVTVLATISCDSGGSADHNVQGAFMAIDPGPNTVGVPANYSIVATVVGQTITNAAGKGLIAAYTQELPTPRVSG